MKVAINDANILIDFFKIGLLEELLTLNLEMHTTDLVVNEVTRIPSQKVEIEKLIGEGKLLVNSFNIDDLQIIISRSQNNGGVSIQDCSIWYWAEINSAILLTGEKKLRKLAQSNGVEVHGSLWLLDELLIQNILNKMEACQAVKRLVETNNRLPKDECQKRISSWCL
ncbi:MAG: hypothetical protein AAF573_04125 [Bacteroidota bacterium]